MALETENGDERGKAHGILNQQNIEPDMLYYTGTVTRKHRQPRTKNLTKRVNPFDRIQRREIAN